MTYLYRIRLDPPSPEKTPIGPALAIDAYPRIALSSMQIWTIDRYTLPVGERWVNPLPDEAPSTKWEAEQKDPLRGLFFLTGLQPVLRLRRSTPSARCAFGAPPSQLDRPCAPPGVPLTTGSTLRLSTYSFALMWMIDPLPLQVGERFLNPLPDEASSTKWEK